LIYFGVIRYWHIIILVTFLGAVNSLNQIARQSLINSLVPKEDLMNAISLNSTIVNLSRVIGPSIAGVIIAFLGITNCFLINGISFLAILYSLYLMDHRSPPGLSKKFDFVRDVTEGWTYVWNMKRLKYAIITSYTIGFFGQPYSRFNSIFARDILKIGPGGFGLLMAFPGIGALCSALVIASLGGYRYTRQRRLLFLGTFFFGFSLIVYGLSRNLFLSFFVLIIAGGAQMISRNSANLIVQSNTSSNLLGRTMGILFLDTGLWSLGALAMGAEASIFGITKAVGAGANILGITKAVVIGGGVCALSALVLGFSSRDKKEGPL
ncbi:MAG: MFS transporter, partial [bacterium]|nr:MFS transporter [bacterium]